MMKGSGSVQTLYELCRTTFGPAGAAVSPHSIRKLCALMDTIGPRAVGLTDMSSDNERGLGFFGRENLYSSRTGRWALPITYLHIYECESFTIGIFCLPTSSVIPLHDHPGMTVLSKILYGSMHVKAYDWIEPAVTKESGELKLAKLQKDTVLTASSPTSVLYPKVGGNLHCFTSIASCAVLDVLAPPYSDAAGRFCTYYHDYPYSSISGDIGSEVPEKETDHAWLAKVEAPDDLYIRSGIYRGPPVQEGSSPGSCTIA